MASYKDARVVPCDSCPFLRPYTAKQGKLGHHMRRLSAANESVETVAGAPLVPLSNAPAGSAEAELNSHLRGYLSESAGGGGSAVRLLRERLTKEVMAYRTRTAAAKHAAARAGLSDEERLQMFRTPDELFARGVLTAEEAVEANKGPKVHPVELRGRKNNKRPAAT